MSESLELLSADVELPPRRSWLLVSERFLSHQGEGVTSGQLSYFVRLGACNLTCVWCDTPYTWSFTERHAVLHRDSKVYDPRELKRVTLAELSDELVSQPADNFVITGGEPMLQQSALARLVTSVRSRKASAEFEIETAGTIVPQELSEWPVHFNVSPKLASSGNSIERRRIPEALSALVRLSSTFKFVITRQYTEEDITEVCRIIDDFEIPSYRVWLMPEGTDPETLMSGLRVITPYALDYGWNVSGRLHIFTYGDKRGV